VLLRSSLTAGLLRRQRSDYRMRINAQVQIGCRAQMSMPKNLLRNLDVASGLQHGLDERVAEQVRMNRDARPSTDVAQGRLKARISKGLALTFSRSDPNGMNVRRCAALTAQVLFVNRPKVVGDGHPVLLARALQPHGDGGRRTRP
jgi:hypothetical protein